MISIEDSLKKFSQLPIEAVSTIDSDKIAKIIDEMNKAYKINLYPLLIFLSVGDVSEDEISVYLKREFALSPIALKRVVSEFKERILLPLEKRLNFLSGNFDNKISTEEEREIIIDIFKENILEEINNHARVIMAVNARIFAILSDDLSFKKEIEKTLYHNTEKISSKDFLIDGKKLSPSIGNWLRYFIKLKGTEIFDNVVLSSFITKSENAKKLEEKEKKTLYKVLNIYRNIKFFPESMPNDNGDNWEIIPLEHKEVASRASQLVHPKKQKGKDVLLEELKGNIDNYAEGSLEREILEEESEKDREYHKLLLLAKKYPEGSLERRAVEDEMEKLRETESVKDNKVFE